MKKYTLLLSVLTIVLTFYLGGCADGKGAKQTINISAAISMKNALNEIKTLYEKDNPQVTLNFNFASSGTLQRQIEHGAPVDVFISAGKKQMDELLDKGLVESPHTIAGNQLVLVKAAALNKSTTSLQQLAEPDVQRIAIGTPDTVPAGKYAREAMKKTGIWEAVSAKLVFAKDVRQVLDYVETGNVDAGLVYRSDTVAPGKIKPEFNVPGSYHSKIVYPAAVTTSAENPQRAAAFLQFLETGKSRDIFKKYGFTEPETG
ncbi:MAG: molybdate ABC transporter substrate-binding protein [Firmicutes bacterium HGW-Firmicutes-14]|nr:MAG: molybdate ABC transporter substrate-binding protein [Firmicutes bacterium HGW-Firmicutes-14]